MIMYRLYFASIIKYMRHFNNKLFKQTYFIVNNNFCVRKHNEFS